MAWKRSSIRSRQIHRSLKSHLVVKYPFQWGAMFYRTDDLRIKWTKVVLPPVFLEEELPTTEKALATVHDARKQIRDILTGADHRLLVVVGPCSIHDTKAAVEYAGLLKTAIA